MNNFTNQQTASWAKQNLFNQIEVKTGLTQTITLLVLIVLFGVLPILVGLVLMLTGEKLGVVSIIFGALMLFILGLILLVSYFTAKKNVAVFNANGVLTKNNKEYRWENLYYVNYKRQSNARGVYGQGLIPMLISMLLIYLVRAMMTAGNPRAKAFQGIELIFSDGKAVVPSSLKNFDEVWNLVEKIPAQPRINGVFDASTMGLLQKEGVFQPRDTPQSNQFSAQSNQFTPQPNPPTPFQSPIQTPQNYQPTPPRSPQNFQPNAFVSPQQMPQKKSNIGLWIGLAAFGVVFLGIIFGGLIIAYRLSVANSLAKSSQPVLNNSNSTNKDTKTISKDEKADIVYTSEQFYAESEKGSDKRFIGKTIEISGRLYPLTNYINLKATGTDSINIGISETSKSEVAKLKEDERVTFKCFGKDNFPKLQNCVLMQTKGIVSADDMPDLTFTATDYFNKYSYSTGSIGAKIKEGDKIKGKIVDISGKVKIIGGSGKYLSISGNDWVTCYSDPENEEKFKKLTEGQEVKFRGISDGDHLNHCMVISQ